MNYPIKYEQNPSSEDIQQLNSGIMENALQKKVYCSPLTSGCGTKYLHSALGYISVRFEEDFYQVT